MTVMLEQRDIEYYQGSEFDCFRESIVNLLRYVDDPLAEEVINKDHPLITPLGVYTILTSRIASNLTDEQYDATLHPLFDSSMSDCIVGLKGWKMKIALDIVEDEFSAHRIIYPQGPFTTSLPRILILKSNSISLTSDQGKPGIDHAILQIDEKSYVDHGREISEIDDCYRLSAVLEMIPKTPTETYNMLRRLDEKF